MLRLRDSAMKWREVDGETMLLDLRTSTYLAVNGSATVLWRKLAEGTTRNGLVDALCGSYDIDAEQAGRDVDAFLSECAQRGYVDEIDVAPGESSI